VFFDGRNDFYGPDFVKDYLTVMRAEPDWQRIMAQYALTVALVPKGSAIKAALSGSEDWKKVREDSVATVFVRKVPAVAIPAPVYLHLDKKVDTFGIASQAE
jgi:hypothetical protein